MCYDEIDDFAICHFLQIIEIIIKKSKQVLKKNKL